MSQNLTRKLYSDGIPRVPWLMAWFVLVALFISEPMSLGFSDSETFLQEDLDISERVEANIEDQGGRRARQIGVVLLGMCGAWCTWSSRQRLRLTGGLAVLVMSFLVWVALSTFWSDEPLTTLKRVLVLGCLSVFALGAALRYSQAALLEFVVRAVIVVAVISMAAELALGRFRPWDPEYRFAGINWPAFTAWSLSLLVIGVMARWPELRRGRTIWVGVITAAVVLLLLTKTRASAAGLVAGAATYGVLTWSRRQLAVGVLALSAAVPLCWMGAEMLGLDPSGEFYSIANLGREDEAKGISGRGELWGELATYVGDRPLTGYGYETFWTPGRLYAIGSTNWGAPDAHNGFLNLALGTGVIGAGLFVLMVLASLLSALVQFSRTREPFFAFAAATIVILIVNTMFVATQLAPTLNTFITLVVMLRLGLVRPAETVAATAVWEPKRPTWGIMPGASRYTSATAKV